MVKPDKATHAQIERDDGAGPKTSAESGLAPDTEQPEQRELVYRRLDPAKNSQPLGPTEGIRARGSEIAPAITPLIIGFTLLLVLIFLLGYLSVGRMDNVNLALLELERQHAARLGLLLNIRLAVTKVNNEARARGEAEARRELKPPFDFRLSTAREEVNRLVKEIEKTQLAADPTWGRLRGDLRSYVEVTEDLRRYSLEGFGRFDIVDQELDELLTKSGQEQADIILKSEALEQEAARAIRFWSIVALLVGAVVAAGTMWEVQRRFRQMRRSMFEARRERVFTQQLLEGMVSAVAAIDENDRIRSANAAFFEIFPGASIGASVYEKFASEEAMKMLEAATASRVLKATYRGRWVCRAGEESEAERTFDVYSSPLAIDGDEGQILTLVDATEAAEAERGQRRQESLAAVGQATAQVAHEIRNPLGSIRLGVSMLRDSVSDQEALRTIELVERGIKHLNKLVVDVSQFSRQKGLDRSNVDLNELLDRSLDLVADLIKEKKTPVKKIFGDQMIGHWDADQLRQVFVNVIANAIDASPEGGPITISTEALGLDSVGDGAAARQHAQITIADQGKGIDKPTLRRIFEPFFSTKKRGTGLGLAIVSQIVDQHGGKITVNSEPNSGATFIIDLPL